MMTTMRKGKLSPRFPFRVLLLLREEEEVSTRG